MSVKVHEAVCIDSAQDRYFWFDHFLGDQLKDEWRSTGDAGGSAAVVDAQTGGIVRITTNNVDTEAWRIDWTFVRSLHVSMKVTMEVRAKLTQTTSVDAWLALYFDFSNRIFFDYDTATSANWYINCVDGGTPTSQDSGIAADTSYHIFRIECQTHGSNHVHFYIDGVETGNSPITTNIPDDAGDFLMPYLRIAARENVAKSVDIDYVVARQER